jgi:hypothetical protein
MARLVNSKWLDLAPGTAASDGVNFSQLDQRLADAVKRQAYWHGTPVSGVIVTVTNGTTILDTVDASPPYFYPSQIFVRQVSAGSLTLGAATISLGTNASTYDNIFTITQLMIGGLGQGRYIPIVGTSQTLTPLPASSVIRVRVAGLVIGTAIQLGFDILGSYRNS